MPQAERLKNEQLAEKRSFEGNCEILGTMFQLRALSSDIPASRKGVYLFYNPPNNCSRQTHVDHSCIFCGCFRVSLCRIANQLFNFSVTGFCKKYSFVSHDRLKLSLNACSFLGLYSVEIKSDGGHQIGRWISFDSHRPILYHVIIFIQ